MYVYCWKWKKKRSHGWLNRYSLSSDSACSPHKKMVQVKAAFQGKHPTNGAICLIYSFRQTVNSLYLHLICIICYYILFLKPNIKNHNFASVGFVIWENTVINAFWSNKNISKLDINLLQIAVTVRVKMTESSLPAVVHL